MCGVSGFIGKTSPDKDREAILKATRLFIVVLTRKVCL